MDASGPRHWHTHAQDKLQSCMVTNWPISFWTFAPSFSIHLIQKRVCVSRRRSLWQPVKSSFGADVLFHHHRFTNSLMQERVSKESRVKKEEAEREPREGFQKLGSIRKELKHSVSRAGNPSRKSVKNFQQQQPATPLFLTFLCNTDITHLSPTPQPTTFSFKWMKKDPIQKRGAEGHQRWWIQREPNCTNSYDFLVKLAAPKRKSHDGGYNNI